MYKAGEFRIVYNHDKNMNIETVSIWVYPVGSPAYILKSFNAYHENYPINLICRIITLTHTGYTLNLDNHRISS